MEAAAGIAGFVTLTTNMFESCVQAIEFFSDAQHIGYDGDMFVTRLSFEQYQLIEWGIKAGLTPNSTPSDRLNWPIAYDLLKQLEALLTSAEALKNRYGLEVDEEEVNALEASQENLLRPSATGIGKFIAKLKPEVSTIKGQIIQANNSVLKRLRWAAFGKDKADTVIRDISDLRDRLDKLLDPIDRDKRAKLTEMLLRNYVSQSSTASEVMDVQHILAPNSSPSAVSIKAAATLKRIRLVIGTDRRADEIKTPLSKESTANMPSIRKLKHRKLSPYAKDGFIRYQGMEFVRYEQRPVLVEWKRAEAPLWGKFTDQVRFLAVMLASPAGKESHSLLCIGWLPWEERELYALVYDVARPEIINSPDLWEIKTLHDLMLVQRHISLGRRFEIAKLMAESVLQLHTCGWLHKSLRSDNVIFIAPRGSSASDFLQCPPYLVGFEYARPDTMDAAAFTQLVDTDLIHDLYRHPQARGIQRAKYRKQFDMYALGCLLVELSSWTPLPELLNALVDKTLLDRVNNAKQSNFDIELPSLSKLVTQQDLLDPLLHSAGEAFTEAIILCGTMDPADDVEVDASLNTQHTVVEKLRKCNF